MTCEMFKDVKGYASRENAIKVLNKAIANWTEDQKNYVSFNSMIVALPNGRFVSAVRFSSAPDFVRVEINGLLFVDGICLF